MPSHIRNLSDVVRQVDCHLARLWNHLYRECQPVDDGCAPEQLEERQFTMHVRPEGFVIYLRKDGDTHNINKFIFGRYGTLELHTQIPCGMARSSLWSPSRWG